MDQIPPAMDKHLDVVRCHSDGGILLGASSLTGRYWLGSLWYYRNPEVAPDVEKCTAGVQLEAGLSDARWIDATKVLVGLDTGGLAVWELTDDYNTFIQQHAAMKHDDIVSSVCVCNWGKKALSASYDRSVKVWDLETLTSLSSYKAHADIVWSVQWHPVEADIFMSCSQDGRVFLWDTRKAKPVTVVDSSPLASRPTCVAWQPESQNIFSVGGENGQIVVKDTRESKGTPLSVIPHSRSVYRIEFCPKRPSLLASVSEDCTTVVTSIEDSAKQVYVSDSHKDFVQGLSWCSETTLYTCGWDSRVLSHPIPYKIDTLKVKDSSPVKMEINGSVLENESKDEVSVESKDCNGGKLNGNDSIVNSEDQTQQT